MTISELQAENERLKAERDYCQRYYHDVVVEAKRLKAERDEALRSVQVLMESSADNLRLAVTREHKRDEARARAARLAEALRKAGSCWRCGGKGEATFSGCHPVVVERPCKSCKGDGLRGETRDALASTDALAWLNEQIAAELEAVQKMVETEEELPGDPPAEISQYFTDTPTAVRCLRTAVRGTKRSISAQLQRRIADALNRAGYVVEEKNA